MSNGNVLTSEETKVYVTFNNKNKDDDLVKVQPDPPDSDSVKEALTLHGEFTSLIFGAIFMIAAVGAIVFIANAFVGINVVNYMVEQGRGPSLGWLVLISLILALIVAHMAYRPYIMNRAHGNDQVLWALIFFTIAYMYWSTALFQSEFDRSAGLVGTIMLLASTVWLCWVCYHQFPDTVFFSLLLLAWVMYLQYYTFVVAYAPWTR